MFWTHSSNWAYSDPRYKGLSGNLCPSRGGWPSGTCKGWCHLLTRSKEYPRHPVCSEGIECNSLPLPFTSQKIYDPGSTNRFFGDLKAAFQQLHLPLLLSGQNQGRCVLVRKTDKPKVSDTSRRVGVNYPKKWSKHASPCSNRRLGTPGLYGFWL